MNLVETLRSFTAGDVILVLIFLAAFFAGYVQGLIRQLIGLLIWIVGFILALNLRAPVGAFLQQYWTQFTPEYTNMLAFAIVFLIAVIGGNLVAQFTYKRVPVLANRQFADEILGGLLSLGLRILEVSAFLYILDSFYRTAPLGSSNGVAIFSSIYDLFKGSVIAGVLRTNVTPGLLAILGPFVPTELRQLVLGS